MTTKGAVNHRSFFLLPILTNKEEFQFMKNRIKDFLIRLAIKVLSKEDFLSIIFESVESSTVNRIEIRNGFSDTRIEFTVQDNQGEAKHILFSPLFVVDSSLRSIHKFEFKSNRLQ